MNIEMINKMKEYVLLVINKLSPNQKLCIQIGIIAMIYVAGYFYPKLDEGMQMFRMGRYYDPDGI